MINNRTIRTAMLAALLLLLAMTIPASLRASDVSGANLNSITQSTNSAALNIGSGAAFIGGVAITNHSNVSSAKLSDVTQATNSAALNIGSGTASICGISVSGSSFSGEATALTQATNSAALNIGS